MKFISALFSILLLAACQNESGDNPETSISAVGTRAIVSGTVTYRERILLQPGTSLSIVLEDVSRANAPARQIASLELADPGQVPIAFELEYSPADIDELVTYALRARIWAADGSLWFINDTHIPVITHGAGNHADILLVSAGRKSATDQPGPLEGSSVNGIGMDLRGQFSYMADAARFRDCSSGRSFPVEMSGQYIEIERTYLNSGNNPGSPLTVDLVGRYLERPGMEENTNEIKLIVDEFKRVSNPQDCTPDQHADLRNTYWKLLSLNGDKIKSAPDQREAHLLFHSEEDRVNGNGGCNSFFGSYTLNGTEIGFSGIGSTMMACVAGMETEQSFLLVLNETNRIHIEGQFMDLYKNDSLLARFEAIYF